MNLSSSSVVSPSPLCAALAGSPAGQAPALAGPSAGQAASAWLQQTSAAPTGLDIHALHAAVQQRVGDDIGDDLGDLGMDGGPPKRAREEAAKSPNDRDDGNPAPLTLAAMEKMMTNMTASMTTLIDKNDVKWEQRIAGMLDTLEKSIDTRIDNKFDALMAPLLARLEKLETSQNAQQQTSRPEMQMGGNARVRSNSQPQIFAQPQSGTWEPRMLELKGWSSYYARDDTGMTLEHQGRVIDTLHQLLPASAKNYVDWDMMRGINTRQMAIKILMPVSQGRNGCWFVKNILEKILENPQLYINNVRIKVNIELSPERKPRVAAMARMMNLLKTWSIEGTPEWREPMTIWKPVQGGRPLMLCRLKANGDWDANEANLGALCVGLTSKQVVESFYQLP